MIEKITQSSLPVEKTDVNNTAKDAKLQKVCADFESLLIQYILKAARKTLPGNDLFDKSHDSQVYKSMMDEQLAVSLSQSKGMGLGDLLYNQLKQIEGSATQMNDKV